MTPAVQQVVREAMDLTGASAPALLADDAPVLSEEALAAGDGSFYLVGLIGGKDVGKSSLVNALAGREITQTSAYGPGTESVIAYAHRSQEGELQKLLERLVPGKFRIVTHDVPSLARQVLLDLPDIDSHFASHLQLTRTMLRHMLFPLWLVSIEKYADRQPQQMLAQVAAGNAPGNFIFCLNKVDQIKGFRVQGSEFRYEASGFEVKGSESRGEKLGSSPGSSLPGSGRATGGNGDIAAELRQDYAARVQRTLSLDAPPHVYLISATDPRAFDLPDLKGVLARQKPPEAVRSSQELAGRRQDAQLLAWLEAQQLPLRAQRLSRLEQEAQELAAERIGGPLLDRVVPRLLDDPAVRGAIADQIMAERVARWPLVRLVHTLLAPLLVLLRGAVSRGAGPLQPPLGQVELVLRETAVSPSDLVQTTFAQLRQSSPTVAELYGPRRLWEGMWADAAAAQLRTALADALERQRETARQSFARGSWIGAPLRWLLTLGAVLWFPFAQPVLHALLGGYDASTWLKRAALAVSVLGVDDLLRSLGFLILYFICLWLALRWNTQHKVARLLGRWKSKTPTDPSLDLAAQTLAWIDGLLEPLRAARQRMESLSARAQALHEPSVE